jgi:phosphate transport system substrate-binding protein
MNGTAESVSGPSHSTAATSGEVATRVQQTKGAIAYDTVHFATVKSLKTISIDGAAPTANNAISNTYKFWNVEHMYTKGEASGLAKAFIAYIAGPDAASSRQALGFVDISQASASILATRKPVSK